MLQHLVTLIATPKSKKHRFNCCRALSYNGPLAFCFLKFVFSTVFRWVIPCLFLVYFRSFSNNHYNLYNKSSEKCPSSIQCWDSNTRLLKTNLLPWPIDQGSRPFLTTVYRESVLYTKIATHSWWTSCGQSYKASTIVNYDSRVVPDWKIPHITILES